MDVLLSIISAYKKTVPLTQGYILLAVWVIYPLATSFSGLTLRGSYITGLHQQVALTTMKDVYSDQTSYFDMKMLLLEIINSNELVENQSGPTQNQVLEIAWIVQKCTYIPYKDKVSNWKLLNFQQLLTNILTHVRKS